MRRERLRMHPRVREILRAIWNVMANNSRNSERNSSVSRAQYIRMSRMIQKALHSKAEDATTEQQQPHNNQG